MPIRFTSRLYRNRHGTFYFRLGIPRDLHAVVGPNSIRFSLATEERAIASQCALALAADLPLLFTNLREMAERDATAPRDFLSLWIAEKKNSIRLKQQVEELTDALTKAESALAQSVPLDKARRVVTETYLRGQLKGKAELERASVISRAPDNTPLFSTLLSAYLKILGARLPGGSKEPPTEKTLAAYKAEIGQFIDVMGDMKIGFIDRDLVAEYANLLRQLPANLNKLEKYRGKSIPEILSMKPPAQSIENVSKKIERTSTMFEWAIAERKTWHIDSNPFSGYGQAKKSGSKRRPFTIDELKKLLSQKEFTTKTFGHSYTYWLIPLALYTGARLGELAQLDLKDFVVVEGIPCIDINDTAAPGVSEDEKGKSLKTANAFRLVPIHPELIRLGLLDRVNFLREQGETAFFPDLSRGHRDGPTHPASKWFQRFRLKAGLAEKQTTVFHSFRHLFITTLLDNGIPEHMVAPIVGHERDLVTGQIYWNIRNAAKRAPTVNAFSLPEEIRYMIPRWNEITQKTPPGRKPSESLKE